MKAKKDASMAKPPVETDAPISGATGQTNDIPLFSAFFYKETRKISVF